MANYCMKCGTALTPGAKFCPGCGAPIADVPQAAPKKVKQKPKKYESPFRKLARYALPPILIGAAGLGLYSTGFLQEFWYGLGLGGTPVVDYVPTVSQLSRTQREGLNRFTGCWLPIEDTNPGPKSYVIGLIYVEEYDEFGYFERQLDYWMAMGNWYEVSDFTYDEYAGVLTIPFDNGEADFWILPSGNMMMSNYGGSYEFRLLEDD